MRNSAETGIPNPEEVNRSEFFTIKDISGEQEQQEYISWARDRVLVLPSDEFNSWMIEQKGGIVLGATGYFFNKYGPENEIYFDSAINEDMFIVNGEDYRDLIPYAIEHEVQESLAKILIRTGNSSSSDTHSIGMTKEFELAAQERKQDRLYEYFTRVSPGREGEFQEAYDAVRP